MSTKFPGNVQVPVVADVSMNITPATAAAGQRKDAAASTPRGRSPARRTAPPAALEAWKLRALRLVAAVVVCDYIGVSMMRVTLPFYAQALGGKVINLG